MAVTSTCSEPNEKIAYDVIGPFKYPNKGKLYSLTIQDSFSKFVKFCPLEDCTSKSIAKALIEEWILNFGIPRVLLSDNGPNLCGEVMAEVARYFGIARITTAIGYPQANGSCERVHQTFGAYLRTTEQDMQQDADWAMRCKMAAYAINTTVHKTTGYTPHQLMYGRPPRLISAIHTDKPFITAESYIRELQLIQNEMWAKAKESTNKAKQATADRDVRVHPKRKTEDYKVGQMVWVKTETLQGKHNRTVNPWKGPFQVLEVTEHNLKIKKRLRETVVNKAHCSPRETTDM